MRSRPGARREDLTTIVAKVEAVGPSAYVTDLSLLENRFQFQRYLRVARNHARMKANKPRVTLLTKLIDAHATLRVVDLTQPLGPDDAGHRPAADVRRVARRHDRGDLALRRQGAGWYWNTIRIGEHTGTHFDAPVHWMTGKDLPDNACDTIPPRRFVGPACVIDVSRQAARRRLSPYLTNSSLGSEHGRIPAGAWVLLRTDWSARRTRCRS